MFIQYTKAIDIEYEYYIELTSGVIMSSSFWKKMKCQGQRLKDISILINIFCFEFLFIEKEKRSLPLRVLR